MKGILKTNKYKIYPDGTVNYLDGKYFTHLSHKSIDALDFRKWRGKHAQKLLNSMIEKGDEPFLGLKEPVEKEQLTEAPPTNLLPLIKLEPFYEPPQPPQDIVCRHNYRFLERILDKHGFYCIHCLDIQLR